MGLMALADQVPIVSLAVFGGSAEEIWAMLGDEGWIDTADRQEMARGNWADDSAAVLIASLERQRTKLHSMYRKNKNQNCLSCLMAVTEGTLFGGVDGLSQGFPAHVNSLIHPGRADRGHMSR